MTCRHAPVMCRWRLSYFPLTEFCCCRSKNLGAVRLRQRSTNLEPMRKKVISFKHVKLRIYVSSRTRTTRKQQNTLQLTTITKIAVKVYDHIQSHCNMIAPCACASTSKYQHDRKGHLVCCLKRMENWKCRK